MKFNRCIRNLCTSCILIFVPLQAVHAATGGEWRPSNLPTEREQFRVPPPPPPAVLPSEFRPVTPGFVSRIPPQGVTGHYAAYPPRGRNMSVTSRQYPAPAFARQYAWRPISPPLVARAPQPPMAPSAPMWGYTVRPPMPMARSPWVPPSPWAVGYAPPMPMPPQYGPPPPPPPPPWMLGAPPVQLSYGGYGAPSVSYPGGPKSGFAPPTIRFPRDLRRPDVPSHRGGALGRYGSFPALGANPWRAPFPSYGAIPLPLVSPWGGWPNMFQPSFGWWPDAWRPGLGGPLGGNGLGFPLAGMLGEGGCLWCGG